MEHAVASREQRTVVTLRARRVDDMLRVSIEDNGPGPLNAGTAREGIGLRNTREMLAQLYGQASSVTLRGVGPPPYIGACTEVTIPISAGHR
jgi:two-component system, LytTR family, sensor kinase